MNLKKAKIIFHLKKKKKKKNFPEEVFFRNNSGRTLLPETSSGNPKRFRKKPSSGKFPEAGFFRKTFGFFRKNTSSGKFPENVLPEVPEEPITGLPEASSSAPFPHFFRHLLLSSSTLWFC